MRHPPPLSARLLLLAIAMMALALPGCWRERVVKDPWASFRDHAWADRPAPDGAAPPPVPAAVQPASWPMRAALSDVWAIQLESFQGEAAVEQARRRMNLLQRRTTLTELWLYESAGQVHLYHGRYADPTAAEVAADLRQVRLTQVDGLTPYAHARLALAIRQRPDAAPADPFAAPARDRGSMDLKDYKGQDLYTLQVAVFDEQGGRHYRQAAEQYARQLRQEGFDAYYFHSDKSAVTVGLFTYEEAFDSELGVQDRYSELIRKLQERFPHVLGNGMTLLTGEGDHRHELPTVLIGLKY